MKHKFKTSAEMDAVQKYLTAKAERKIDCCEFDDAIELLQEIKEIDTKRRKMWHKEKFGAYEEIADETLKLMSGYQEQKQEFASDDIPF